MNLQIVTTDVLDFEYVAALTNLLGQHIEKTTGYADDYWPLSVVMVVPGTDDVMAGLHAGTKYGQLHVLALYVHENLRGRGVGRRLMYQAEEEARRRTCTGAWLDTFSPDALKFYERLDYSVFGVIDDFPPGQKRFFLKKTLVLQ